VLIATGAVALLSACSSDGSLAAEPEPATAEPEAPTVELAEPTAASEAPSAGAEVTTAPTAVVDTTRMDTMLSSLGVTDVEGARACVLDGAALEGMSAADLMAGTGGSIYIMALRCDDTVAELMVGSAASFDTTGTDTTVDDVTCVQTTSLDYFATLSLADAENIFAAPAPPDELVDMVTATCGISRASALLVMG